MLILVTFAVVASFLALDLDRYLMLEALKPARHAFRRRRHDSPVLIVTLYFLAYVAIAALSLPGAAIMTPVGGALHFSQ